MDPIKEVVRNPLKSAIMSYTLYNDLTSVDKISQELNGKPEELQRALDFLASYNFLARKGACYRKTAAGWKIAYALKVYEILSRVPLEVSAEISASSFILDIGCGGGARLSNLGRYTTHTIGIDVDPESLYIANIKSGAKLIRADAQFLPFRDNTFDLIICHLVMPYVENEERAIAEASRVLKRGGKIEFIVHGLGFYLRKIFGRPERKRSLKEKLISGIVIINTLLYWLTGRKLRYKKSVFETFQSVARMRKSFKKYQIETIKAECRQGTLSGFWVFIGLEGRKL